ncbi:hypothetical protein SAMN06265222_105288 [Neorhodopirellula lusitana]|uniref:Uncharacterized protein n=1 Tax=Neorhodopirellula lusitana TaxID=445327 RepID=A0ABY1Q5P1_9BACT|nr:hypothetical protein SAMN06265222_105288 [Neorhodopirellula lusitana]
MVALRRLLSGEMDTKQDFCQAAGAILFDDTVDDLLVASAGSFETLGFSH